jgi:hypothetical protein
MSVTGNTLKGIRDLAQESHLLYYGDIAWFLETNRRLLSREQLQGVVHEHRYRLKLLSLFFDHIILPPSSLLMGSTVANALVRDAHVKALAEGGIIITTYWPWCVDLRDFAQELSAFLTVTIQQEVTIANDVMAFFRLLAGYKRDVGEQSTWVQDRLEDLLTVNKSHIISNYGKDALGRVRELAQRAEGVAKIPFNMERFGVLVADDSELPGGLIHETLRSTWGLYFEGGVVGNFCGRYTYSEVDAHAHEERVYHGVSRVFFAPQFLEFFLKQVGISAPRRLTQLPSVSMIRLRELPEWQAFRSGFWEICTSLSSDLHSQMLDEQQLSTPEQAPSELTQALRKALLAKPGGRFGIALRHASRLLVDLGQSSVPLLQSLATYGKLDERLERIARRLARPGLTGFVTELRRMLRK